DARPVDGRDRERDRGGGPPRLRDAAYLVRALYRGSDHRPVPGRPAEPDPRHALREPEGCRLPDALQEDRGRAGAGARSADRDAIGIEPDPRSKGLPDPVDHADG